MTKPVISIESLSKCYLVGHEGSKDQYQSLRDTVIRHGRNFARKTFDMVRGRQIVHGDEVEEFWALTDVSFDVPKGEVLGIVGRNGAGKSTLLKILSRITEPTKGKVTLNGRVASLLEVGTGFHPELTGRENIFLNGAILGMTRAEIRSKFDQIVAFAGVEKFLDTPVKRYSSGMYVRLAFSVAAHLEPEILIVDEVLAVGDAEFQKKCLGKMKNVAEGGRTVLFVSHNLGAVRQLCTSCVLMSNGRATYFDDVQKCLDQYLSVSKKLDFGHGQKTTISDAKIIDGSGRAVSTCDADSFLSLEVTVWSSGVEMCSIEAHLIASGGENVAILSPGHFANWYIPEVEGTFRIVIPIEIPLLASGRYTFDVSTRIKGEGEDHAINGVASIEVSNRKQFGGNFDLRLEYGVGYFAMGTAVPSVQLLKGEEFHDWESSSVEIQRLKE